jgi:hypothetical protein
MVLFAALLSAAPFYAEQAQNTPNLGAAASFAVLGGSAVTLTDSIVTGDVGVYPGTTVTNTRSTIIGTVDSVTMADPAKGTKSEIVVVNTANTKMSFLVVATTTLYNAKGETIGLDKIVKGNEVNVEYETTAEGVYEAVSVKVTK